MTGPLGQIALLAAKDLRVEARSRQTLGLVTVTGILVIVVLGLGLGTQGQSPGVGATAILWVAYLFSGVLCFEKTMAMERHDGARAGLLAAPIDRGVIFASKLLTNLALMLVMASVITLVAVVLFRFDLSAAPGGFAAVTLLSMIGFATVGTLFAAVTSSSRLQGGLLAVLVFPICLPLVITSTQLLTGMFRDGLALDSPGVGILASFDAVYLVVSWLAFERVLEP